MDSISKNSKAHENNTYSPSFGIAVKDLI